MKRPTVEEIASNQHLWNEYVNPGNDEPDAFDEMSTVHKMRLIVELWPEDVAEDDEEGQRILEELNQ